MIKFNYLRTTTSLALLAAMTFIMLPAGANVYAQCPTSVHASGLAAPVKVILTREDYLLVAESGSGPNTGRISIVDRDGLRRTLIDGLPSGFAPPNNEPSGPSGLVMRGRTLFVAIGEGDATLPGPAPGTNVPNPNPSSPIFSSVLALYFSEQVERRTEGFTLTADDRTALDNGERLLLRDEGRRRLTVELITDFPDFVPNPRPGLPNIVRPSNPFGLADDEGQLYVVDAGMNLVRQVSVRTGDTETLTTFAPLANPLFPFGPPFIDPVPDSIRVSGNHLLVTLLTGFPFPQGLAQVRRIDPTTGGQETLITGLSSAIDVLTVNGRSREVDQTFTLEFSANQLAQAPGRLQSFASPDGPPTVIADCLITPTSMAYDRQTRELFVTEIATGRIVRIPAP